MRKTILCGGLLLLLAGCATTHEHLLDSGTSQVQLRSIQSRKFNTADKTQCLRTVIACLQDLDFIIDKADDELGTVSATKLNKYELRMTVSVRPHGGNYLLVRASIEFRDRPVHDPEPYQSFFTSLEKAMFLTAQQVD